MSKTTFYTSFPLYATGKYDSFFLLKFFPEEQFRDYFLSGNLYMRQHTEFANQELGTGRFDITEGADVVAIQRDSNSFMDIRFIEKDGGAYVQITEMKDRPDNYRENQAFISYPVRNQQRNLFCMYTLWCNDSVNSISCLDKDKMSNFGEYGIILTNPHRFINLVATASEQNSSITQVHCGFVNYIPESQMKNVMEMNPFRKPAEDFSYQNEFRICADTDNTDLLELSLGQELRDISIPVRLTDFANSVQYRDGKLLFKADSL